MKTISQALGGAAQQMIQKTIKIKPTHPFEGHTTFDRRNEARGALFCEIKAFADSMTTGNGRWLAILGKSGTGKTHLAREVFSHAKRNFSGWVDPDRGNYQLRQFLWLDARKLAQRLRDGEWELRDRIAGAFLVVLDDIFATRDPSGFVLDELEAALNSRLGKWTVITSNLLHGQIADQDPRIASRLRRNGSTVLEIKKLPDWNARLAQ